MSAVALITVGRHPGMRGHWLRPRGGVGADAILRVTGVVGLLLIAILQLVPGSAAFLPLIFATLLFRGPASGLVPIGVEPVLMLYGQQYSPWWVAGIAVVASAYAEFISQHLVRGVLELPALERTRNGVSHSRIMRLFDKRPALAIAITALSPIPDVITRVLAAASRYPVGRYVVADAIGRFPKLYLPAALATTLRIPPTVLWMIVGGSIAMAGGLAAWRWTQRGRLRHVPNPGA